MLEVLTTDPAVSPVDGTPDEAVETREEKRRRYLAELRRTQEGQGKRLADFLKSLRDYYRTLDSDARLKRAIDTDRMIRTLVGDTYGQYDQAGVWQSHTLQPGDHAYTIPVLVGHVEQAFSQLLKTQVEYEFTPKATSGATGRGLARMCTELADEEMRRLFDEDTRQDEILNTLVAGESPRYLYWGPSGRKVKRPDYRTEDGELGGAPVKRTHDAGPKEVDLGHNRLHVPPPLGVQYDLSARSISESTFVVERDLLRRKVAEWTYQCQIMASDSGISEEMRLRRDQERMSVQTDAEVGSNQRNWSGGEFSGEVVERSRHYLDVVEYASFYLDQEERTPEGDRLAAGKLLGELFPKGLYFTFVGDTLVEVEACEKRRKWSMVRYGKRPGTNRGAGMQTGIPIQNAHDDNFNLVHSSNMTVGHPMTVVNRKWAKELPDANNMLFVSGEVDARSVVYRVPGASASQAIEHTTEMAQAALQHILGTQSVMGTVGAPDAKAMGTATGIAATVENAALRMTGPIGQRIAADKELRVQILENIREHACGEECDPELAEELNKRYGPDLVSAFGACDPRLDLDQAVRPNTDRPRSTALIHANLLAMAQIVPALVGVPGGQEIIQMLSEVAGVPLEVGPGRGDRREAEYRLNKLEAIIEEAGKRRPEALEQAELAAPVVYELLAKFVGPLVEMPDAPPSMFMQDHDTFMDAYRDALFSEEARMWEPAHRLVVMQLWLDHFNAKMGAQVKLAEIQAEVRAKLAPPPPPAPDPGAEAQARLTEEALKREADEESKDADVERKMALTEHEAMVAQQAQQNGGGAVVGPVP